MRGLSCIVAGYSVEAVGLTALLTINGQPSVPQVALAATVALIAAGFLLPTAGMLVLRSRCDKADAAVRRSLLLQGSGLVVLFLGVVLAVGLNSLPGFQIGAVFLFASAASALLGAISLRNNHDGIGLPGRRGASLLVLGLALLFSGVGLIIASNIAFYYIISGVANAVYTDVGVTLSACGCVVAAYSFFEFRRR